MVSVQPRGLSFRHELQIIRISFDPSQGNLVHFSLPKLRYDFRRQQSVLKIPSKAPAWNFRGAAPCFRLPSFRFPAFRPAPAGGPELRTSDRMSPLFCSNFSPASRLNPATFCLETRSGPECLCHRRQSARLPAGTGPRSRRVPMLGFRGPNPHIPNLPCGFTGTATRKGHENGFPQATVAPHKSPPTHL